MFYTLFYKKSHLCLNKCIIISTIIYIIIQYLLFSNIFNFSDKIKKIAYSFYIVLIIDIILFCYSVKNDIDVQQKNFNEENDKYTKSIAKIKETLQYKDNIEYDQFQNDNEFESEVDNKQQNNDNNDNQLTSEINNETNVIAENTDFENNDNTFDHSDKSNRITFISDDNNVNEQDINIASINDDKIKNLTNIMDNIKSKHSSNSIKNTQPIKDNNESITIDHTSNNSQNIHNINNENDMIIEGESITFE